MAAIPTLTLDNPAVLELLKALGLDPAKTGDVSITAELPVAGVVTFRIDARIFATEAELDLLRKVIRQGILEQVRLRTLQIEGNQIGKAADFVITPEGTTEEDSTL
jgi:hypothetical protein